MEQRISKLISSFKNRNIPCSFVTDRYAAQDLIIGAIPRNSTVGIGGSVTIKELDLEKKLTNKGCQVIWHWRASNEEESIEMKRLAMLTDIYLSSTNAVTLDGRLINIDGSGNRVASMVFGPKKVIIVLGVNKIAEDLESALYRIKKYACPQNARRLNINTPCAMKDYCNDCKSSERMCNITMIIEGKPSHTDFRVVIVGENLGY